MFSLHALASSQEAGKYYLENDNYYVTGSDPLEKSYWQGEGAKKLGLSGQVDEKTFLSLLDGRLPNGAVLGIVKEKNGERQHRPGTDVTFSAPKSVSLLALVGKDERLLQAHRKAVNSSIAHIEKMAAEARITINGEVFFDKTGNLCAASFEHHLSRALDAQLHTHSIIANATERRDGKWAALSSRNKRDTDHLYNGFREFLYDNQHYLGLFYQADLAKNVIELGYEIEVKDKYGNFEIKGFSKEYLEANSKRRTEIKERLQSLGLGKNASAKAHEIANQDTKSAKVEIERDSLEAFWQGVARQHNVDFEGMIKASKDKLLHKGEEKLSGSIPGINAQELVLAKQALGAAVSHLSQYQVNIRHADLLRSSFEFANNKVSHPVMEQAFDSLLKEGVLVGERYHSYTSQNLLDKEKAFKATFSKQKYQKAFSIEINKNDSSSKILASDRRIAVVDVENHSSEKNLIESLVNDAENAGHKAFVLCPVKEQTMILKEDVKRDTSSFIRWCRDKWRGEFIHSLFSFERLYQNLLDTPFAKQKREDVIVVHDAQKLRFADIERLQAASAKTNSKLIFLNNKKAMDGMHPGSPMQNLKESGIQSFSHRIDAMSAIKGHLIETKSPHEAAIKEYCNQKQSDNKQVVTATRKDALLLNEAIREELKAQGKLSQDSQDFVSLSNAQLSEPQKGHLRFYGIGDKIIFNRFSKKEKSYQVAAKEDGALILSDAHGKKSRFSLDGKQNYEVIRAKSIAISKGDKLYLESAFYSKEKRFDKGQSFSVVAVDEKLIYAKSGDKSHSFTKDDIKNMAFSHDYARPLAHLQRNKAHALLCAKPYQMKEAFVAELGQRVSGFSYFCPSIKEAKMRLSKEKISLTIDESHKQKMAFIQKDISEGIGVIKKDLERLAESITGFKGEASGMQADSRHIASTAISYAMAKCQESDAVIAHKDLLSNAMLHALGKVRYEQLEQELHTRMQSGDIKHLDTHWISKEALELEKNIINSNYSEQKTQSALFVDNEQLQQRIPSTLTKGQRDSIHLALTTEDRFITIQGFAGVGKTTMAKSLQNLAEEKGVNVYGLAPTNKAKEELIGQGIESMTVDSFLIADMPFEKNSLVIVDEVSMLSNRQYHALQKRAVEKEVRLLFTGDRTQYLAIEAGNPHELTLKSNTQKAAHMEDIVRQNNSPELKKSVLEASKMKMTDSFKTLEGINPANFVRRESPSQNASSIVEIPLKKLEKGEEQSNAHRGIYTAIVDDYFSRTKSDRAKTLLVAPENAQREVLEKMVRERLKMEGVISGSEKDCARLLYKDLKKAEKLYAKNYEKGDVLCFDASFMMAKKGDYFTVEFVDTKSNTLHLKHQEELYQLNTKETKGAKLSVFTSIESPLALGDKVRIRKTIREEGLIANAEFRVLSFDKDSITLFDQKTNEKKVLDNKRFNTQHWDYAHTNTAYSIQGGTDKHIIGLLLAASMTTSNHRAYRIIISRAKESAMVYTEDKKALLFNLSDEKQQDKANKKSALLMMKAHAKKEQDKVRLEGVLAKNKKEEALKEESIQSTNIASFPIKDYKQNTQEIERELHQNMESLCLALLGEPNRNLSKTNQLRYGSNGSLSVNLSKGLWKNFETDKGGNCLSLIKEEMGYQDFKEVISYAKDFLNIAPTYLVKSKVTLEKEQKELSENEKKMIKMARRIVSHSKPIKGTVAEKYLKDVRGLENVNNADILYNDRIKTKHGDKDAFVPALVAIARDNKGDVSGIELIKLDRKTANIDTNSSLTKQSFGKKKGCFVELNRSHNKDITYICEGIATGLSAVSADKDARVITSLGKSNFPNLSPKDIEGNVVLCVDNDGKDTFKSNVIIKTIDNFEKEGREVRVVLPQKEGQDLNDILKENGIDALKKTLQSSMSSDAYKQIHSIIQKQLIRKDSPGSIERNHDTNHESLNNKSGDGHHKESKSTPVIERELER